MSQDGTENPDDRADRIEALIADAQAEAAFDNITRPEELADLRAKLWQLVVELAPPSEHERLEQLVTGSLDRLLDALVVDGRRIAALTMRTRKLELEHLQLKAQQLQVELRLLALEKGGTLDPTDPEAIALTQQLLALARRLAKVSS